MRFLDEKQALEAIRRGIRTSASSDLAVAFWGNGAIEEMGIAERAGSINIILNLESGGTNPKVVKNLLGLNGKSDHNINVSQNDRLHAKVYLFDDFAVVGSSNASTNGLAFEGSELTHWTEANILLRDPQILKSLRDWMTELGHRKITPSDIARAKTAWKARRRVMHLPRDQSRTLLEALRFEPEMLSQLPVFVAVYSEDLSAEAKREQGKLQRQWGTNAVGVFEGWPELPTNGLLLAFLKHSGTYRWDGAWERRGADNDQRLVKGHTSLQVVWEAKSVFGKIPIAKSEYGVWNSICEKIVSELGKKNEKGLAICLPILELIKHQYLPEALQIQSLETDVWRSVNALEAVLSLEKGKTSRLSRTRPKIKRVGEQRTVEDLVSAKRASTGFRMLMDRNMAHRTFEAVALRHPERFDDAVLKAARARLDGENVKAELYLSR